MRSVLASILLPVVAVVLIGPYTFVPSLLEYALARDVESRLGLEKAPQVSLQSDPPVKMLAGEFSDGRIVLRKAALGGVRTGRTVIDLDPFDVNVLNSLQSGSIVTREPLSGQIRIEVPEAEVSRLAQARSDVAVSSVDVEEDGMVVTSEVTALGATFPVSVEGNVGLRSGRLAFEPRSLVAAGSPVPRGLADRVLAGTSFDYRLDRLPYRSRISGVRTTEQGILLIGKVPSIPLGVYPLG